LQQVSHKLACSLEEVLTSIWQQVLQQPSMGLDDNFFDAGGNLSSADLLFAGIARECGRTLPSATIYHAPTIRALASLMEQPALPRFSHLVKLKDGHEKPPILIAHGLGGSVQCFELAKQIQTQNPVYGILAKGIDGMEEPLESIEDMATLYLNSIKELQPRGPYILVGYSFGGLVALEMAQRMSDELEGVALLVLVDAYPHPRYLSAGQRLRLGARRVLAHASEMKHRQGHEALAYFIRGLEHRLHINGGRGRGNFLPGTSSLSFAQTTSRVEDKAYAALARYRPRFYKGKIKFVKNSGDFYFPSDPAPVWAKLAAEFESETVPGGHLDMVTTHFQNLAAVLTRYVKEAFCRG
jgi:acetoacetyl-CoA synthetase